MPAFLLTLTSLLADVPAPDSPEAVGGVAFVAVSAALSIGGLVFWIWALVHAIKNPNLSDNLRIVWVMVIVFANLLGAIIYAVAGRNP